MFPRMWATVCGRVPTEPFVVIGYPARWQGSAGPNPIDTLLSEGFLPVCCPTPGAGGKKRAYEPGNSSSNPLAHQLGSHAQLYGRASNKLPEDFSALVSKSNYLDMMDRCQFLKVVCHAMTHFPAAFNLGLYFLQDNHPIWQNFQNCIRVSWGNQIDDTGIRNQKGIRFNAGVSGLHPPRLHHRLGNQLSDAGKRDRD